MSRSSAGTLSTLRVWLSTRTVVSSLEKKSGYVLVRGAIHEHHNSVAPRLRTSSSVTPSRSSSSQIRLQSDNKSSP